MKKTAVAIALLFSGLSLASVFPPLQTAVADNGLAIWFALVPLFWLIRRDTPRQAFFHSFAVGAIFWTITLSWFPAIIKNNGPWPLVLLGWAGLAAWCSLFFGIYGAAAAMVWRWAGRTPGWRRIATITVIEPLLWAGAEWVRSWLFTGFAWNFLGVGLVNNLPLIQISSVFGVYGASALVVLGNSAIASMAERTVGPIWRRFHREEIFRPSLRERTSHGLESLIPFALIITAWGFGLRIQSADAKIPKEPWLVALIQPNAPCVFESTPERVSQQFNALREQTTLAARIKPDLMVWPETSTPGPVPFRKGVTDFLADCLKNGSSPLLTGTTEEAMSTPTRDNPQGIIYYNSAWLFSPDGAPIGAYRKQHLVPFGEYVPFDKTFPALQRLAPTGVSCYAGTSPAVMTLTNATHESALRIGPLICFEDTVAALSRNAVNAGANVLALMTNDAWFNRSCEPLQHQQQAVFRAVENRVPMIRAANSGVTCTVSAVGKVEALQSDGKSYDFNGYLTSRIYVDRQHSPTPYTRCGDWTLGIPGAVFIVGIGICGTVRRRREKRQSKTSTLGDHREQTTA